jgi:hypothetical protein
MLVYNRQNDAVGREGRDERKRKRMRKRKSL